MANNALTMFDMTIWADQCEEVGSVKAWMREWCKKWVFQLETSSNGKDHWQCRISLFKKKRKTELLTIIPWPHTKVSPTCKTVHDGQNFNYVMKAESRKQGPYRDADKSPVKPKLTRQLRKFKEMTMYPWQEQLVDLIQDEDDRRITCIVDIDGNNGKSILCEYIEFEGMGFEVPFMNCLEDIMQCCMSVAEQKCFLIDFPRGLRKDKLQGLYGGLECLKNGMCYDKRYSFKKRRFDRPQVVVFTNEMPDTTLMSKDRWAVYKICHDRGLMLLDV